MRNLSQYPITPEEVDRVLDSVGLEMHNKRVVGDCRPLILRYVREFVAANPESFDAFLRRSQTVSGQ